MPWKKYGVCCREHMLSCSAAVEKTIEAALSKDASIIFFRSDFRYNVILMYIVQTKNLGGGKYRCATYFAPLQYKIVM